ncbi:hypothetical protein Pcinc_008113 [Petrolisthes cinctipes]|uniref:Uncharacterized protein n=1 Tax=Petrolisthes cinctipes TaxID=88211 RepID=A0AAE1KZT2_PETCI|nr:hypothetical protein Pcinc_008113 [Petrolisthes cinctipes]
MLVVLVLLAAITCESAAPQPPNLPYLLDNYYEEHLIGELGRRQDVWRRCGERSRSPPPSAATAAPTVPLSPPPPPTVASSTMTLA